MGFLKNLRRRKEDEDMRSAYPDAWASGEHLANFQFRDLAYSGMDAPMRAREREKLAENFAPEAWERFLSMKGLLPSAGDPFALQAFRMGFTRRLENLLKAYAELQGGDEVLSAAVGAVGAMKPGSAEALISEARNARFMDETTGGPLTSLAMQASFAAERLRARGATDSMSLQELAAIDANSLVHMLEQDVFRGVMPFEDALAVVSEGRERLKSAAEAREARLRGGPLLPR